MTEKYIAEKHHATFEELRRLDEENNEFWLARQLSKVLGYSEYRHFLPVVERAKDACINSNIEGHGLIITESLNNLHVLLAETD